MRAKKQQIWGNHLSQSPDELMVQFCAGRDVAPLPMADAALLPYDLWTNRAHAIMLFRQGILPEKHLAALLKALKALEKDWEAGKFTLNPKLEDVHINVENYVTPVLGREILRRWTVRTTARASCRLTPTRTAAPTTSWRSCATRGRSVGKRRPLTRR